MNRSVDTSSSSSSSLIDAAALQSDISRRFGLNIRPRRLYSSSTMNNRAESKNTSSPTTLVRRNNNHMDSKVQGSRNQHQLPQSIRCNTCQHEQTYRRGDACERCGTIPSIQPRSNSRSNNNHTLAERRGLVALKVKSVSPSLSWNDWDAVETEARVRNDAFCPICMEGFSNGHEVLLSCSHVFHRTCLQNFEKFMRVQERSCPICRRCNYQKKITSSGSKAFESVCARKIQALWRGFNARIRFHMDKKLYYNSGQGESGLRAKFYFNELQGLVNNVESLGIRKDVTINGLLGRSDQVMYEGKQLDIMFDMLLGDRAKALDEAEEKEAAAAAEVATERIQMATQLVPVEGKDDDFYTNSSSSYDYGSKHRSLSSAINEINWDGIIDTAIRRADVCAICLGTCLNKKKIVILSCSHNFHQSCIQCVENGYQSEAKENEPLLCPVCREPYIDKRICMDVLSLKHAHLLKWEPLMCE